MEYFKVQSWPIVILSPQLLLVFSACVASMFTVLVFLNWPFVGLLALGGRAIPVAAL